MNKPTAATDMEYAKNRTNLFNPLSKAPFRISRSKIDLFLDCPRCFYLDRRIGIARPEFPAFTLNSAVDHLLKKEFDIHRTNRSRHPLLQKYGVDAVPYAHAQLEQWRHNFTGIQYLHAPTNLLVFGAVDDVWENPRKELYIVDYKATAKDSDPNLDGFWQQGYKRQMEVYQWLFRRNGFAVSDVGYFVYVNGRRDRAAFDGKLEFKVHLIAYKGNGDWIEPAIQKIRDCLHSSALPEPSSHCEYCAYRRAAAEAAAAQKKSGGGMAPIGALRAGKKAADGKSEKTKTLF